MNVKVVHVKIMELALMTSTHSHASVCQAGLEQNVKQVNRYDSLTLDSEQSYFLKMTF